MPAHLGPGAQAIVRRRSPSRLNPGVGSDPMIASPKPLGASPSAVILALAVLAGCSTTSGGTSSDAGAADTGAPEEGTDGAASPIGFQPSNVSLAQIEAAAAAAQNEDVKTSCTIKSDRTGP